MTAIFSKLVFDRILKETRENNQGREDPYFETVPIKRMGGAFTTNKKRPKALPPGLSDADQKTLVKVKRRAYRLDSSLGSCCGIKMGIYTPRPRRALHAS